MFAIHVPTVIRRVAAPMSWAVAMTSLLTSAAKIASNPASSASRAIVCTSLALQPTPGITASASRSAILLLLRTIARSAFVWSAAPAAPHDRATTTRHAGGIHNQRAFRVMTRLLPCDWLTLPAYHPPWRQSTARRFFGDRTEPCPAAKIPPVERFRDRVAVVTGAASGIGLALAERFAAEGMKVVMADIETAALDTATAAVQAKASTVLAVRVDVSRA